MQQTGSFVCSDTILNKVYHNAEWAYAAIIRMPVELSGNVMSANRGWATCARLFQRGLCFRQWPFMPSGCDIAESQREDGCIPDVAPAFWNYYSDNVTWPSALPFSQMLYNQYGDDAPMRKYYPNVKRWLGASEIPVWQRRTDFARQIRRIGVPPRI